MTTTTNEPLLTLADLEVTIDVRKGQVWPLQGCTLEVAPGETLGLVGNPAAARP